MLFLYIYESRLCAWYPHNVTQSGTRGVSCPSEHIDSPFLSSENVRTLQIDNTPQAPYMYVNSILLHAEALNVFLDNYFRTKTVFYGWKF